MATYSNYDAQQKLAQLTTLRQQLDSGQISVSDFIQQGQPLAQYINDAGDYFTSQGQEEGQTYGEPLLKALGNVGFDTWMTNPEIQRGSDERIRVNLPEQYQEQLRETLLPSNLTEEQKQAYLKDIPTDIKYGSDQWKAEFEGLRERQQQEAANAEIKAGHTSNLTDLAKLLSENQNNLFNSEIPDLAEQANTKGIFRSTGFGDSLAREYARLTASTQNQLAQKALEYGDQDLNGIQKALDVEQSYQGQGISRVFGSEDYSRQLNDTLRLARESAPQNQGKTGTEKAEQALQIGLGAYTSGATGYNQTQQANYYKANTPSSGGGK
jgi:hypothetical protein